MKEIGGYLGLEELIRRPYYPDLAAVNNARSALLYILRARRAGRIFLPYYLCGSVRDICRREGYPTAFYHIGADFLPEFDGELADDEYLYVVNYYGQIGPERAAVLKSRYGNVILDNVQAFFQRP